MRTWCATTCCVNRGQRARAEASARYGDWLTLRTREHGVPVMEPRPWSTALDRLCAALEP
jgi:hypothetical protein